MSEKSNPRVGVACFLIKPSGKVLIGIRTGSHGANKLQIPGGHLEYGETLEICSCREIFEETGLIINPTLITFLTCTNDIMINENKHYITIFMKVNVEENAIAQLREPLKCLGWNWISFEELKSNKNLFLPLENLFHQRNITINDILHPN